MPLCLFYALSLASLAVPETDDLLSLYLADEEEAIQTQHEFKACDICGDPVRDLTDLRRTDRGNTHKGRDIVNEAEKDLMLFR